MLLWRDPRIERSKRHKLLDIIAIAICATICGADSWVHIEMFGRSKEEWFRTFLELPGGIPSHDTFGEVFSRLDPEQFQSCFMDWTQEVAQLAQGEVVAIDGKTVRRSHDRSQGRGAIHLVSAWASSNTMTLGQVKVGDKSNEITAIPRLLELLALQGCVVTIDAMGCQREIAEQIVEAGADYVLAVKENQGQLNDDVRDLFHGAEEYGYEGVPHDYARSLNKGHGRIETRGVLDRYRPGLSGLPGDQEAMGWAEGGGESQCPPGDGGWRHGPVPLLHQQLEGPGRKDAGGSTPTLEHREFTALDLGHDLS